MKTHACAELWPGFRPQTLDYLRESIARLGYADWAAPILLWRGLIVDGRLRQQVCDELQVEPRYYELSAADGQLEEVCFAANGARRSCTDAVVDAKLPPGWKGALVDAAINDPAFLPTYLEAEARAREAQGRRTDLETSGQSENEVSRCSVNTRKIVAEALGVRICTPTILGRQSLRLGILYTTLAAGSALRSGCRWCEQPIKGASKLPQPRPCYMSRGSGRTLGRRYAC